MIMVAKMNDKLVEIIKTADRVGFSEERGWICICVDFWEPVRRQQGVKWIPASTRFDWVREFNFGA